MVSTGIDVTQRSQAERNLEKVEARANAVLNSVIDAIINIDARGAIQMFNPAATRMFGYREDEVLGKNVSLLMGAPQVAEIDVNPVRLTPSGPWALDALVVLGR